MIYTFQRIEGFVCSPWMRGDKRADFLRDMSRWMREDGGLVAQVRPSPTHARTHARA